MALRKYLRNGVVEKVQQPSFERIVEFLILSRGREYRLVVEIFGGGNIILVDSNGKILHALSYRKMRDRHIIMGEMYHYPPQTGIDPRNLRREELDILTNHGQVEVIKVLAKFLGIGGFYAEEVLFRSEVPKNKLCVCLSKKDLDSIFEVLKTLLSLLQNGCFEPCIFVDENGSWIDVAPFCLRKYLGFKCLKFDDFNKALDEFYMKTSIKRQVDTVKVASEKELSKLNRILREQEATLNESKQKSELYKKIGDSIYIHLNDLQLLLERIMKEKRDGKDWREISKTLEKEKRESRIPAIFYESLNPKTIELEVSVEGNSFSLDLRSSVQKNAAKYYEMAKREEKRAEGALKSIELTRKQIERAYIMEAEKVKETSEIPNISRKRMWYEKFRWFHSSEGFLVIGGRDESTNESIIKKYLEPNDMVFHAEVQGAPFVVVKTRGATPSEQTVKEASQFAASYSSAWKKGVSAVDVYWVRPEQVSKTPPSGEYLPRGSFMIYGTKNYVKGENLEVAIGLLMKGLMFYVIGGPIKAIADQTDVYVTIVPGKMNSGNLAKQIRKKLAEMLPEDVQENVFKLPLEEIQRFLPAGGGNIK